MSNIDVLNVSFSSSVSCSALEQPLDFKKYYFVMPLMRQSAGVPFRSMDAHRQNGCPICNINRYTNYKPLPIEGEELEYEAVSFLPASIGCVKKQTKELCEIAVSKDPLILELINDEFKTKELCEMAIAKDPFAIMYVNCQTEEMCNMAFATQPTTFPYLKYKTPAMYQKAVNTYGLFLEHIDDQTVDICMQAITNNPDALQFVKDKTYEMCELAIGKRGSCIKYIDDQADELCKLAVKMDGTAIRYIKNQTHELCLLAAQKSPYVIAFGFINNVTPELIADLEKNGIKQFSKSIISPLF